jgi:2,4-didehydro-3-deoxy-L-rhamnonate hydrolase
MRLANIGGRLAICTDGGYVDVAAASSGRFGPAPMHGLEHWPDLLAWAEGVDAATLERHRVGESADGHAASSSRLGIPVSEPRQVFAIGLNYRDHVAESGLTDPPAPAVFTKFPACLTGPRDSVGLPPGTTSCLCIVSLRS